MASPDYKPIFKVPYNPVKGLSQLLQGYNTGAQQKFMNNNVDRNAPVGANEYERMQMEKRANLQAYMDLMNPTAGIVPSVAATPAAAIPAAVPSIPAMVQSGQQAITGAPTNISPATVTQQPADPLDAKVIPLMEEYFQSRLKQWQDSQKKTGTGV